MRSWKFREPISSEQRSGFSETGSKTAPDHLVLTVAAHVEAAGGQVDEHVAAAADLLVHRGKERQIRRGLAGLRVAHVDVGNGGAGLPAGDGRLGDLLWRVGHRRIHLLGGARTAYGGGDDDLVHKRSVLCWKRLAGRLHRSQSVPSVRYLFSSSASHERSSPILSTVAPDER